MMATIQNSKAHDMVGTFCFPLLIQKEHKSILNMTQYYMSGLPK